MKFERRLAVRCRLAAWLALCLSPGIAGAAELRAWPEGLAGTASFVAVAQAGWNETPGDDAFASAAGPWRTEPAASSSIPSIVPGMDAEMALRVWTHDPLSTTMVPEPRTYALWLSGLAVIGFVVLRRRGF
jgi:hypothetical protein